MNTLSLGQKVHRTHLFRRSPIVGVFGDAHDLEISRVLQIVAEVFADGVAVLEILLLKKAVHDSDIACARRVLFLFARPSTIFVPIVSK